MKETVFIDIDTQYDFMKAQGKLYVKYAQGIIPNLRALTKAACDNGILIISSVDTHLRNDPEFRLFPVHCVAGTPGQKKLPETLLKKRAFIGMRILRRRQLLAKLKGLQQLILEKNTYDVFSNFNLLRLLRPFRKAFVYGVALDYCVRYAVLGLLQIGLEVNLVTDAVKTVEPEEAGALLSGFKNNGVRLIKTKDVLSRLKEPAR